MKKTHFLIRDRVKVQKNFEILIPSKKHFQNVLFLAKQRGMTLLDDLWVNDNFYLELEQSYPMFKGRILARTQAELEKAERFLEQLITYFL